MSDSVKFNRLGTMIDCSRNAVLNVSSVKRWIDLTSDLGYNCVMPYIEDTYEVNDNPYFGHLRGRYSQKELKEIDDYAFSKGMEVIPCIQTLAHVNALFQWPLYREIRDYDDILMAGDERVYELVDNMFASIKNSMRSKIINIGMDEAMMMGRGAYMTKNGVHDRFEILMKHLNKVSELARKYDFQLIMWGDMFFRIATGGQYYADNVQISDDVKKMIPDNVNLIYWDYYSTEKDHYDRQIEFHAEIKDNIWFAGGLWRWSGMTPHNTFSINAMSKAVTSCLDHGIQNVFMTMWGDNGGECSPFAVLPSLYYISELAKGNTDADAIRAGFEKKYGIPFDEYRNLDLLGTPNDAPKKILNPDKYMLYCDCFMGKFDNLVRDGEAESYGACGRKLAKWENNPDYGYLFRTAHALCRVLEIKFDLGVRTRRAYLAKDHTALKALIADYDELLERIDVLYETHRDQWMKDSKPFGFDVQDLRYGGLIQRVKYCRYCLVSYLNGSLERIEELECPVLDVECRTEKDEKTHIHYNNWEATVTAGVL